MADASRQPNGSQGPWGHNIPRQGDVPRNQVDGSWDATPDASNGQIDGVQPTPPPAPTPPSTPPAPETSYREPRGARQAPSQKPEVPAPVPYPTQSEPQAASAQTAPTGAPQPTHSTHVPATAPQPADQAAGSAAGVPPGDTHPAHHELYRALGHLRLVALVLTLVVVAGAALVGYNRYQAHQRSEKAEQVSGGQVTSGGQPGAYPKDQAQVTQTKEGVKTISCLATTGPDATTESQKFVPIDGTQCTYRSGSSEETLVLNGKLTGRNTEGTGMSVTLNVNGLDCNGGESLNYSNNWTPMFSNCSFKVPAESAVTVQWRFLSPFGGSSAVLRSSKNIAPSINGVAVPRGEE